MYWELSQALQVHHLVKISSRPHDVWSCYHPCLTDEKTNAWNRFTACSQPPATGKCWDSNCKRQTPEAMHTLTCSASFPLRPTPWLLILSCFRNVLLESPGPKYNPAVPESLYLENGSGDNSLALDRVSDLRDPVPLEGTGHSHLRITHSGQVSAHTLSHFNFTTAQGWAGMSFFIFPAHPDSESEPSCVTPKPLLFLLSPLSSLLEEKSHLPLCLTLSEKQSCSLPIHLE